MVKMAAVILLQISSELEQNLNANIGSNCRGALRRIVKILELVSSRSIGNNIYGTSRGLLENDSDNQAGTVTHIIYTHAPSSQKVLLLLS
jgi:hypothetical protein